MPLSVMVAVDEDLDGLENVRAQLVQRYGRDYRIEALSDPDEALSRLTALRDAGADIALVLAGQSASGAAAELLDHVRQLHPHAKRVLLVSESRSEEHTSELQSH